MLDQIDQIVGGEGLNGQTGKLSGKGKQDLLELLKQYQRSGDLLQGLQTAAEFYPTMKPVITKAITAVEQGKPVEEVIKNIEHSSGSVAV